MLNDNEQVLMLYACCIPVKGARRSIICDLQRKKYFFIPNAMYEILSTDEGKPISFIREKYNLQAEIIDEYVSFLLQNDICFLTGEPNNFPKLDLTWKSPSAITNAIIDSTASSRHNFPDILNQLNNLGCVAIQFRYFSGFSADAFSEVLRAAKTTRFRSFELLLPYYEGDIEKELQAMVAINKRLTTIVVHSAPYDVHKFNSQQQLSIIYIQDKINSSDHCGFIHPSHFRTDTAFFTESIHFNSCLNRKIGVDADGNIRNCPSHEKIYGNMNDTTMQSAIDAPGFKDVWNITKEHVSVCKDCEFRRICTDCRVFTVGNENTGKPAKCNYDPYTSSWISAGDNPQSKDYQRIRTEFVNHENLIS